MLSYSPSAKRSPSEFLSDVLPVLFPNFFSFLPDRHQIPCRQRPVTRCTRSPFSHPARCTHTGFLHTECNFSGLHSAGCLRSLFSAVDTCPDIPDTSHQICGSFRHMEPAVHWKVAPVNNTILFFRSPHPPDKTLSAFPSPLHYLLS